MRAAIRSHRRLGLFLALAVLIVDQVVKYVVTGPLGIDSLGESREILPIFNLSYVENHGVSMGLLRADGATMRWALVALTIALSVGVTVLLWKEQRRTEILGLGLILGGALGNILDRVRVGFVVDYADLHFGAFRPFLVFNIADAAIAIGAVIFLGRAMLARDKAPVAVSAPGSASGTP